MRNKAGSAGVGISSGGLSKYKSDSRLPTLNSKHTTSLANFKDLTAIPQNSTLVRPIAPPTFNEGEAYGSLPRIQSKPALKGSISQPPKTFPKLVRIKDDEDKKPDDEDEDFLKPCPLGCGRKFGVENLEKHMSICKKVFTGQRAQFDSSKKRWAKAFKK